MTANSICFVSTLHDPEGRYLGALRSVGDKLTGYDGVYVSATVSTDQAVIHEIEKIGCHIQMMPTGVVGEGRRQALATATKCGFSNYFYCDIDRWLHWNSNFGEELESLTSIIGGIETQPTFVCIGRTRRAFETHPDVQRLAEYATNNALRLAIGQWIDATAGACWMTHDAAEAVLAQSTELSNATDLEWPAIIYRDNPHKLVGIEVEGLEFETASFYLEEIEKSGGTEKWKRAQYDRPSVWSGRLRLAADSIAAMQRILRL